MGMPKLKKETTFKEQTKVLPFLQDGDFCFTKGVEAFQKLKFDIALKWLKKAVHLDKDEPLYKCQLSIIYTETGYFHAANDLLRQVVKEYQDDYPDCYYLLANNYAHLGLLNEAKRYCLLYMEVESEGDYYEDTEVLLELIEIDNEDESLDYSLEDDLLLYQESVFNHLEYKKYDEAMPLLEEMLELFPDHLLTKHDYARVLFFTGNESEAIEREEELLKTEENKLYSLLNLAVFYHEMSKLTERDRFIESLANLYPMHVQQRLRIAITLAKTGNYKLAEQRFEKLEKGFVQTHPSYFRWRSVTKYALGNEEKAEQLWEKALKLFPLLKAEQLPWVIEHNDRRND